MDSFFETPEGLLFSANGIDPMTRWDGLTQLTESVGLTAPATAVTIAKSGSGTIVGSYYAYLRYVDRLGLVSNLSPISAVLDVANLSGTVTGATNKTPIVITTSSAHGLSSGAKVKIAGVGGNTDANGVFTVSVATATTFRLQGSSGNGTYTGGGTWQSGALTLTYSGVSVPTDSKVVKRQILRNTDGQTNVFYVDVDTTDLTSTSLTSTKNDETLAAQTSQTLFDLNGNSLANRHYVPPNHKSILAFQINRMFAARDVEYAVGSCKVTFGSTSVTGVGTSWTTSLAARYLYVVGATRSYLISSVNQATQVITLASSYQDTTDKFAEYSIRPAPAERKLIYYSAPALPESWPPTNALQVQEDGDDITGLMPMRSYLYILEKRHIYKLSFQDDPALDGAVFLAAARGCINNRCWVQVDDFAYMLDEYGVHRFVGNAESEQISTPIQELFHSGANAKWRINWKASDYFHAILFRSNETIRWFVTLAGNKVPRHGLCYNYRLKRWWLEEYRDPIGGACVGQIGGLPKAFVGGKNRKVYSFWEGALDVVNPDLGTTRGTVTSSTITSITDSAATFPTSTIVNAPLCIVSGTGKGQTRRIVSVSGTTINVDLPWLVKPDTTSVYQVGGIPWNFRSGWLRLSNAEVMQDRRLELAFSELTNASTADLQFYYNFSATAEKQKVRKTAAAGGGIASTVNEAALAIDLTQTDGIVAHRLPGTKELFTRGKRFTQFELSGFTNKDELRFYQGQFEGVYANSELGRDE